jgi:molybdate transport system substrate-binding protein
MLKGVDNPARLFPCYHGSHSVKELTLMMRIAVLRGRAAAVLAMLVLTSPLAHAAEIRVAVASNFAAPMERLAPLFQKESGHTVKVSSGASVKLYAQIRSGAPFDVFLSADEELPKQLAQEGLAVGDSRFVYATGRLVLWSAQSDLVDEKGAVLNKGNFNMLAIPNPRLSPYGVAAKETLTKLTMWNAIQEKLTKGENVAQAYQLAATEKADLALIALSQVMRDGKVGTGSWWLVPAELHNPLHQGAVLLSGAKDQEAAKAFLAFLKGEKARAVMRGFGYE